MPDSNASIAAIEIDTTQNAITVQRNQYTSSFYCYLGMYFLLGINGHKDESMDKQEAFSNYSKKI